MCKCSSSSYTFILYSLHAYTLSLKIFSYIPAQHFHSQLYYSSLIYIRKLEKKRTHGLIRLTSSSIELMLKFISILNVHRKKKGEKHERKKLWNKLRTFSFRNKLRITNYELLISIWRKLHRKFGKFLLEWILKTILPSTGA